jgi:hypothetical protein
MKCSKLSSCVAEKNGHVSRRINASTFSTCGH